MTGMEMKEHDTMSLIDADHLREKRLELAEWGGAPVLNP